MFQFMVNNPLDCIEQVLLLQDLNIDNFGFGFTYCFRLPILGLPCCFHTFGKKPKSSREKGHKGLCNKSRTANLFCESSAPQKNIRLMQK